MVGDGKDILTTGAEDGVIRIWDIASGSCPLEVRAHSSRIRGVAHMAGPGATPHGLPTVVVSGSSDGTLKLWDVRMLCDSRSTGLPLAEAATNARLTCLSISPGPAKLREMAIAQVKADKASEAERKQRILKRMKNKAQAAVSKPQDEETFEVVPGPKKLSAKKIAGKPTGAAVEGGTGVSGAKKPGLQERRGGEKANLEVSIKTGKGGQTQGSAGKKKAGKAPADAPNAGRIQKVTKKKSKQQ